MVAMKLRECANAIRGQKLSLVQHHTQHSRQTLRAHDRKETSRSSIFISGCSDVVAQFWPIFDEPEHTFLKSGQRIDNISLKGFHREQRNQTDHGPNFEKVVIVFREVQDIIEKTVFLVP